MYDASFNLTGVSVQSGSGNTVTVAYTGVPTGKTLSAIITDASGEITHYRKLIANITTANGTVNVSIPNWFSASDNLYIFAEEENASSYRHDLAGTPLQLSLSIAATPVGVSGGMRELLGTTAAMEYQRQVYPYNWYDCTNGTTTVEPGTYLVRYKHSGSTLPSLPTATVQVLWSVPVLSDGTGSRTNTTDASIRFTSSEYGQTYALVQTNGDPAPTKETVRSSGSALGAVGSSSSGGGTKTATVTVGSGTRDVWVVVQNNDGALGEPLKIIIGSIVSVTSISGITSQIKIGNSYTLAGVVAPTNATNKTIFWSITDAGTTGAALSGNTLSHTSTGTLTIRATITNGSCDANGVLYDYTQDFTIDITGHELTVTGGIEDTDYSWSGNTLNILTATPLTITGTTPVTASAEHENIVVVNTSYGAKNITLAGVFIGNTNLGGNSNRPPAITIENGATLNLTLSGSNYLYGHLTVAALRVRPSATLNITAESTGSMTAAGGYNAAAIGGNNDADAGTVNIHGGTVIAEGKTGGAGIGGGAQSGSSPYNAGGNVTITGGTVRASATGGGASIGSGSNSTGSNGTLTIIGGSVYLDGNASREPQATNGLGTNVYLATLTVGSPAVANTAITAGSIGGVSCANTPNAASGIYGIKDVMTDGAGKLYFYLPASTGTAVSATASGTAYSNSAVSVLNDNSATATHC